MLLDGSLPTRITATVLGLEAEIEREFIVVRTREALAKRRAEGKPLGAPKGNLRLKLNAQETVVWSMWRGKHEATVMLAHKYAWTA